ncbi:hypothetical protein P4T89_09920 [Bacillus nakamurai]|uniref:Uncharacterized protein n=1 Tax=Bacillus nakamurai TaxID=1793963 RepID=A0A150F297_9BACI|nr:hypothetical protein [Bacillus nakamurai]KXZ13083.1 hypothetical protein AXI58_05230 [Bacillus nakamurai]MED1227893.1 hypothetical protein [Bacillus nakamurai]
MPIWTSRFHEHKYNLICLHGTRIFDRKDKDEYMRQAKRLIENLVPSHYYCYILCIVSYESPISRVQQYRKLWSVVQSEFACVEGEKGREHKFQSNNTCEFYGVMKIKQTDIKQFLYLQEEYPSQFRMIFSEHDIEKIDEVLNQVEGNEEGADFSSISYNQSVYIEVESYECDYDLTFYVNDEIYQSIKNTPLIDSDRFVELLQNHFHLYIGAALSMDLPRQWKEDSIDNWIFMDENEREVTVANIAEHHFPCFKLRKFDDFSSRRFIGNLGVCLQNRMLRSSFDQD